MRHLCYYFACVLILSPCLVGAFTSGPCAGASMCECKWSNGKRTADCTNAGFQSVPRGLSPDIQSLVLDGNPLHKLGEDEFKTAGLLNLQTLSVRHCGIVTVDQNAFRDLKIMIHLDLSYNNLTSVDPKTFDGNNGLKILRLSHNPITKLGFYQFPPLGSLKTVDLSHCKLEEVDGTAFKNLGASVESVMLNNNRLTSMKDEVFLPLFSLKSLKLHSNPWVCDCRLKNFRDWVVNRKLYDRPTMCHEPSRLHGKLWDSILPAEFACKPSISTPVDRVFAAPGVDVTLSCAIMGSPVPHARWVVQGRIVNNNTQPATFADQTYLLHESKVDLDRLSRWLNLTITNPSDNELGDYLCVAENTGGVAEKKVALTFDDPATYYEGGLVFGMTEDQLVIAVGVAVALLVIAIFVLIVCCCFIGRRGGKKSKGRLHSSSDLHHMHNHNHRSNGFMGASGDSQRLLPHSTSVNGSIVAVSAGQINGNNPPKPPRNMGEYQALPQTEVTGLHSSPGYHLEMQDMTNRPSTASSKSCNAVNNSGGSNGSSSAGSDRANSLSRASFIESEHYPDLLDHHRSGPQLATVPYPSHLIKPPSSASPSSGGSSGAPSTLPDNSRLVQNSTSLHTLSPANLMLSPQQQQQYAHLIAQHQQQSPFQRTGTLPLPHHHQGRSISCDHGTSIPVGVISSTPASYGHPTPHFHVIHPVHLHHQVPAGASAVLARPGYVTLPRRPRNGWASMPRDTPSPGAASNMSAASRLTEREPIYDGVGPRTSADGSSRLCLAKPSPGMVLPPQTSTPTSTQTLHRAARPAPIAELQECPNTPDKKNKDNKKSQNILDSDNPPAASEGILASSSEATLVEENLSAYCEPFGKATKPGEASNRNSVASDESEVVPSKNDKNGNKNEKNEVLTNGHNGDNKTTNNKKPPPPKTLPKPKVKPVPPPKPKKSFSGENNGLDGSQAPLISFQDECADGSEV